jgi:archaellum component FlaC
MTTQQLQARHEKGERILDMIKGAEVSLGNLKKTLKVHLFSFPQFYNTNKKLKHQIDITTRALSRLRSYYYSIMEIVPTESIEEIAKEVAKGTEFYEFNGCGYVYHETFESEEYRLEFNFNPNFFQGKLEEISNLEIDELYHNRRKYSAEEIDGLKLLLLEELTRKGKG